MNALNELYIETLVNNGSTIKDNHTNYSMPVSGYMVADSEAQPALLNNKGLTRYQFKKAVRKFTKGGCCAGFWLNTDNNMWYIESSTLFDRLPIAMASAKRLKQLAIFDLSTFEEITL